MALIQRFLMLVVEYTLEPSWMRLEIRFDSLSRAEADYASSAVMRRSFSMSWARL